MGRRYPTLADELERRAVQYVDRRGGPLLRRGGRSGAGGSSGAAWAKKRFDPTKLYAISSISTANWYKTGDSGGEAGDAGGFGEFVLTRIRGIDSLAQQFLGGRRATGGWQVLMGTTGLITVFMWTTNSTFVQASGTIPNAKIGRLVLVTVQHTGAQLRVFLDRMELLGSAAISGFYPAAPSTAFEYWGVNHVGTEPSTKIDHLARAAFRGVPSDAQLTAYIDAARQLGDLPTSMPGVVLSHRWSLREELVKAAAAITDGQIAPASLPDTVTAANVDAMTRQGSPTVKVIDPSVDGRKTYGALGFSATNLLQTAAGIRGASAFTVGWFGIPNALDGTNRTLVSTRVGADGYRITHNATSTAFWLYDGAAALLITSGAALPVGVPCGVIATWAAGVPKIYVCTPSGVVETTGTAGVAGYTPSAEPFRIGDSGAAGDEAINATWFGSTGMDGTATTLAQVQAWWASVLASGRIQSIAGAQHTWDAHADIVAAGGDVSGIVPATVQDRVGGTDHLTKVGSLYVAQRAERVWSYETSPILRGVKKGTTNDYVRTAPGQGVGLSVASWHLNIALRINNRSIATSRHLIGNIATGPNRGFVFYASASNSVFTPLFTNGSAAFISGPIVTMTDADIGRVHLVTIIWDAVQQKIRTMARRAEVGTGTSMVGYTPASSYLDVGNGAGSGAPLDGMTWLGASGGDGIPALAQYQSLWDSVIATEDIQGIPGMTDHLWSPTRSLRDNGGVMPAQIVDRVGNHHMAVTGAPEIDDVYARAWAA